MAGSQSGMNDKCKIRLARL